MFFLLPSPQVSAKQKYSCGVIRLMLVLSKCWLLQGPDRPCVFLQAFWGCESESSPHGAATPDLAWAIPPDVECVLGQWRGAARSHAGRPCLPKLPQRAWPEGFCQHRYQSYSLPVSLSLPPPLFLSLTLSFTLFPFCTVSHFTSFSVLLSAFVFPLTFSLSSLRYPLFHLDNQLFRFQSHSVRAFSSPLPPSHIHTLTFLVWLFFLLSLRSNLFHPCHAPVLAQTFSFKKNVFYLSFKLTTQMLWKDVIRRSNFNGNK